MMKGSILTALELKLLFAAYAIVILTMTTSGIAWVNQVFHVTISELLHAC